MQHSELQQAKKDRSLRIKAVSLAQNLKIKIIEPKSLNSKHLTVDNISRQGLFFISDKLADQGGNIKLELSLSKGDLPISVEALVKWVRAQEQGESLPKGFGVELTGFYQDSKDRWLLYLEDCIERELSEINVPKNLISFWLELTALRLERLRSDYDRMIAFIVHDLRNPLCLIKTANALIDSGQLNPNEYLSIGIPCQIDEHCKTMTQLIDRLLEITKLQAGEVSLNFVTVNIVELVKRAVKDYQSLAQSRNIDLQLHWQEVVIKGHVDELRFSQVLANLIGNAIKFSPNGSTVTVTLDATAEEVILNINNQGQGIKVQDQSSLFKEYSTLPNRPYSSEKSYGLGLASAKRLVNAHGGTIAVQSTLNKGTTFTVRVPRFVKD